MELTDQERKDLGACLGTLELNSLKLMVTLTALKNGKVRSSGDAIAEGKDMIGENIRCIMMLRVILGIPLENKKSEE